MSVPAAIFVAVLLAAGALWEVERALQLNPKAFEIYFMKGWVYELAGQPDPAFSSYHNALSLSGTPQGLLESVEAAYRAEGLAGYYRGWLNRRGGNRPMSDTWRAQRRA